MNPLQQAAEYYASIGWHVLPCVPGQKNPLTVHGVKDATTNVDQIRGWWSRWPDANVAVACGEVSGITVLDVDIDKQKGINGYEELKKLQITLPETLCQGTPSGGKHYFFGFSGYIANSSADSGVHTRNDGGYVILPPSRLSADSLVSRGYTWGGNSNPGSVLPPFPNALVGLFTTQDRTEKKSTAVQTPKVAAATTYLDSANTPPITDGEKVARARAYIACCDVAVQGCGGHNKLLYAADRLVNGFALTDQQTYDILASDFNPKCVPPWDLQNHAEEKDFLRKIKEARRLGSQHGYGWLLTNTCRVSVNLPIPNTKSVSRDEVCSQSGRLLDSRKVCGRADGAELAGLCSPPGLLGEICQWMNQTAMIPQPLLALGAAITFCGAILGQKVTDGFGSRTNLYCMGVAPSSAGKNHAIMCIRNLCQEVLCTSLLGGEYVASDAAIEERLSRQPITLFLWDEIGHLFSYIKSGQSKNHSQVVSVLMRHYSASASIYLGREYAEHDRQRTIVQPCCCIYGTATPESFAEGLSPAQLQDGWLSRCLTFYSEARPAKQRTRGQMAVPESVATRIKELIAWRPGIVGDEELVKIMPVGAGYPAPPPKPLIVPETDEAARIFEDFDNETIKYGNDSPPLACLWKKGEENARRIALIVSVCDVFEAPRVDDIHARYACDLVRFLTMSFAENIAPEIVVNETERRKRKLLKLLRSHGGKMNRRDITKLSAWATAQDRLRLLDDLVVSGEMLIEPANGDMVYLLPHSL